MVAAGVPAAGLRGGWRDYCIVNAPERSGLGTLVVLPALVSLLAFVVAKRWGVGCGTSGSSQRDRPGLRGPGALAAPRTFELWWRVPSRASGVLVELLIVSRSPLHSPLRSTGEWRGQRRSCAWAR